ncbi:MAG TPA: energy transducer TonB [Chitinophagaceae bacterium]|nr:energy transducer TonB [Chitinophagaceae bacterium]HRX94189.1 energy transducer TonB [Chitinophagaceae bacterium]
MVFQKTILLLLIAFPATFLAAQEPNTIEVDGKVFEKIEIEADYPGGVQAWRNYLEKNLNPSVPVDKGAPAGNYMVVVQFVVNKDGNISDIKSLTNHGYGMEQEVLRIIKNSGKWNPAIQDGRPVKAYRKQPVTFQVENDGLRITTETPHTLFVKTDNEVLIKADRLKAKDLYVTITGGSMINMGNGLFKAKVNKPGTAIIRVFYARNQKLIGAESFDVKEK